MTKVRSSRRRPRFSNRSRTRRICSWHVAGHGGNSSSVMTKRVFNFSAGPAMLPLEVLEASAKALVDYQGKGFGIAECSHRGKEFDGVLDEAIAKCKSLLSVPDTHDILFLQGGATQLFNTIPMNFLN